MMNKLKKIIYRIRGEIPTEELISRGLKIGKNFERLNQVIIDDSHSWLIEIGDDVTLAPRAHILAHDASTKSFLGYTKIGRVTIGNKVFVGAETVILPGVTIGSNVIIGANSTVTHDIPDGMVAAGSPARILCTTEEYLAKEKKRMETAPVYGVEYTMRGNITEAQKQQQKDDLAKNRIGYVD
ncbi:MAG: acyltransferase [Clostridia bacterium]|nr:acyltransferase [Clostridia bacterium]